MTSPREIEIVGGGLAGLTLGLALRRAGMPVTLFEAGLYPRHRVCGEFISGLGPDTIERLGLAPFLADAGRLTRVEWFAGGRPVQRQNLPAPALALSRHALDARLAAAFTAAGGMLRTGTRTNPVATPAGRVFATGRRRGVSPWLGLKLHARGLPLTGELEFHLGRDAYVGLCPVEDGWVNVCGLVRRRPGLAADRTAVLPAYLTAAGLDGLASRLAAAEIRPESCSAVAGVSFDRVAPARDRINLGDAFAMIPPFTGDGMAMALQSAELALDPLLAWADGSATWPGTVQLVNDRLRRRFRRRLSVARLLHPFLLSPRRQPWLAGAVRSGCLPLRPIYHMLH